MMCHMYIHKIKVRAEIETIAHRAIPKIYNYMERVTNRSRSRSRSIIKKSAPSRDMAPIAVGNVIPDGTLSYFDDKDDLQSVSVHSLAAGKKVILFGVPGAFTPTCSLKHVPGFIERAEELKSKGVDDILLVSVNDPFVMKAWAKSYPENKHVKFLADGLAKYTHALGLELDLGDKGLGTRSRRFALLLDDLKVKVANIESGGEFTVSSAEEIIKAL